jgi:hypothetical protein
MMRLFYILLASTLLIACKDSNRESDKNIIPPKKMQMVLLDFIKADSYDTEISARDKRVKDTLDNLSRQNTIFEHHKVTRNAFINSLEFYKKNPDIFIPILDSMLTLQDKSKNAELFNIRLN